MDNPYLLHIFSPTKTVSPFDVNMAFEAGYDAVIPYPNVGLEDMLAMTQDAIFSRGPSGVKRTGIFIGGREFGLAMDMLEESRKSMVPPFEVSVFADPSGAITTAAALMACVEVWSAKQGKGGLEGKQIQIFGGTGPVGICAGIIGAQQGAEVYLVSHRGTETAKEFVDEYNRRYGVDMKPGDSSTEEAAVAALQDADIVLGCAKAGVQVLSKAQLAQAPKLVVAADVNAVPPLGLEGVGVKDMGKMLDFTPAKAVGIGALAVGDVKYQVHTRLFETMFHAEKPVYLEFTQAFEMAREITRA